MALVPGGWGDGTNHSPPATGAPSAWGRGAHGQGSPTCVPQDRAVWELSAATSGAPARPQAQGPSHQWGLRGSGRWAPCLPLWSCELAHKDTGPPATPARPGRGSALTYSVKQEGKVQNVR